jgi:hypothetical protein
MKSWFRETGPQALLLISLIGIHLAPGSILVDSASVLRPINATLQCVDRSQAVANTVNDDVTAAVYTLCAGLLELRRRGIRVH